VTFVNTDVGHSYHMTPTSACMLTEVIPARVDGLGFVDYFAQVAYLERKSLAYCLPRVCLLTSIYGNIGNVIMLVGTLGHVKFKVGKPVITGTLVIIGGGWGTTWQGSGPGLGVGR